jgi:pSer/pThr/pTyr-binding forkhead associated (FHA) protein
MAKVIVSMDGVTVKEHVLSQERTTLGRRPYNHIVMEDLAVSGEHAVLIKVGEEVYLEDLNSTNGTFVNGLPVKKQLLRYGDSIIIGKRKIVLMQESSAHTLDEPQHQNDPKVGASTAQAGAVQNAVIKVLSGAAAGREVSLTKVVTTIGKPGLAVAAITRDALGFAVHHVEGAGNPTVNGAAMGTEHVALKDGDVIQLAGTQMQFIQR